MTVVYCHPAAPNERFVSGGGRKLIDHVAILRRNDIDAVIVHRANILDYDFKPDDLIVSPEIDGDKLRDTYPSGIRRVSFAQNGYLIDRYHTANRLNHAYMTTPELVAVLTESDHTTDLIRRRFPLLPVPIIRTHSSGNGRDGELGPFSFGEWPREKRVIYFGYKIGGMNAAVVDGLELPAGWTTQSMDGMTDEEVVHMMRTSAIFLACNVQEGMCAPTSEAMICGPLIACWPGGPVNQTDIGGPMEYLAGRAWVASQNNVPELREMVIELAEWIDENPDDAKAQSRDNSDWFQRTYSREREIAEIVQLMTALQRVPALVLA